MKICTKCKQERPDSDYTKWSKSWCRVCRNEYSRKYMKTTQRENARRCHLKATYGLSLIQWETMLAEQGGKCLICEQRKPIMCVDHDHETKAVRGLLCKDCNSGLGLFKDDPKALLNAFQHLEYKLSKSSRQPRPAEDVLRPMA